MGQSNTKPSIASRIQQHLTAFDFCLQQGEFGTAKLKALQMNQDLEPAYQVKIGHGVNKATIPANAKTREELKTARYLDENCQQCKDSVESYDIHPPKELTDAREKNNRASFEMEWLTEFMIMLENNIRTVGYQKGWWAE